MKNGEAVILLQTGKSLPKEITCDMVLPDGLVYTYKVPTIRVQQYSVQDIREKKLYALIPFMPIRFREQLDRKNPDIDQIEKELTAFYQEIILILDEAVRDGQLSELEYREILELLYKAMIRITYKNDQLMKVVSEMAMPLIEFEFERADRLEKMLKESRDEHNAAIKRKDAEIAALKEKLSKYED